MSAFWRGRRVLVTGHTGFKGAWLTLWLQHLGADVVGLSLPAEHADGTYASLAPWPGLVEHLVDVRDAVAVAEVVAQARPEVVLHLAAQALVRRSYEVPVETWDTNVLGTAHVLEAARRAEGLKAVVVVTSDKVYRNDGAGTPFAEDAPLGQDDPYSSSKAAAELLVRSWRTALLTVPVATARAGNVIGGGDRAQDRLVPDCLRALERSEVLRLRFPEAQRPWQHVLDPLHGYLLLAEALATGEPAAPGAVNFGPDADSCRPVAEVVDTVHRLAGSGRWEVEAGHRAEATLLSLDSSLALRTLGWQARLPLEQALAWTVEWHAAQQAGGDLRALALDQIERYTSLLTGREA